MDAALGWSAVASRVVSDAVDTVLSDFLAQQEKDATTREVSLFAGWLRDFLAGGERLRPQLCHWGWQLGEGADPSGLPQVAAALELFHAFVRLHGDVLDRSETRRGRLSAHRKLAMLHPLHPDPEQLGADAAILLGDLALSWSFELVAAAQLAPPLAAAVWPLLNAMRTETMTGQYLDLLSTGAPGDDIVTALRVARYRTAGYTVQRPLQLGVVLAGGGSELLRACSGYGIPLGEAFGLRDDLAGVFGDQTNSGHLRQGKNTVLLALAWQRADTEQRGRLRTLIGNPELDEDGADAARRIIVDTGAKDTVEAMLAERCERARLALGDFPAHLEATAMLRRLIPIRTQKYSWDSTLQFLR